MSPSPHWNPAGREREAWGCITTFKNDAGRTLTLHRTGLDALTKACDDALSLDATFRIVAVSTPVTIASDLGGRMPNRASNVVDLPEWQRLAKIKRMHLLHPSIQPRSSEAVRSARRRGDMW